MPFELLDHAFAFALAVVLPLEGLLTFRRLVAAVRAGVPGAKVRAYRNTIVMQWSVAALFFLHWSRTGRSLALLGLGAPSTTGAAAGALAIAAGIALVVAQKRGVAALSLERLERLRAGLGELADLLPATPRELGWFGATSMTAGICEELFYRGFAMWYVREIAGTVAAVVVTSALFGFAHAYQGRKGTIKTAIVGLVMAAITLASGTLWAAMIVHAAIDLSAGAIGRRLAARPAVT
jgi:membrane protease YdiL (CAAX protease family)